jgi:hypothetical protein
VDSKRKKNVGEKKKESKSNKRCMALSILGQGGMAFRGSEAAGALGAGQPGGSSGKPHGNKGHGNNL